MRYECKKHSKNKYILTLTIKEQINQIFSEEKKIKEIFFGNSEIFVNLEHSIYNAGDDHHWYIYLIFRFKHMKFMSSEKIFRFFFWLVCTIQEPSLADAGLYRCNAFNAYGDSNANIDLNFESKKPATINFYTVFLPPDILKTAHYNT